MQTSSLPSLPQASPPPKQTEKQKLCLGLTPFGKQSPYFTITGTHAELWHPLPTPSPGTYSLPPISSPRVHAIQGGSPTWPPHPTANVDLFDARLFQWRRPITTDPKPRPDPPPFRGAPGPDFCPATILSPRVIRVRSYFPPLRFQTVTPGPAAYTASDGYSALSYSVRIPKPRDEWLYRDMAYSPDPWHYSPDTAPATPREPAWTIGGKSRRRRVGKDPQRTLLVGPIAVKVPEAEYEFAARVIQNDIELRKLFTVAIEQVLATKPLSPLTIFREMFREMQK